MTKAAYRAALAAIGRLRLRVEGPIGHVDALHPASLAGIVLEPVGREPEPAQPARHGLVGGALVEDEGQHAARLDLAMRAGIGDDGRGAERAFGGMGVGIELDLGSAIGALGDAKVLHLLQRQKVVDGGAEIELADGVAPRAVLGDLLHVAAMVADELALGGIIAIISAALLAGKTVFLGHHDPSVSGRATLGRMPGRWNRFSFPKRLSRVAPDRPGRRVARG